MKKSIPEYIVDGSILVDSVEAFAGILKEFPGRPELLKMHADQLAARKIRDAAIEHYDQAARLFLDAGRLFQAWVSKILQWRLMRPSRDQLLEFHRAVESTIHNGAPVDDFIKNLTPAERMAVFAQFRRIWAGAGKTILKAGERQTHLYLVVSGVLKETGYEMVSQKPRCRREACRVLWEADSFGEVYPFSEQIPAQSDVVANSRVELVMISRQRLMRACLRHPHVESGIIRLCRIRSENKKESLSNGVRKGHRYPIPTRMSVEILPERESDPSIVMEGYSRDLSISGVSFMPERNGAPPEEDGQLSLKDLLHRNVRVTIPTDQLLVAISGQIVRKRHIVINGHKTPCYGIQFSEMTPRLRGAFFAFAEGARDMNTPPSR
jgi:CRP-like cAMP-binding protein